jgi:hypothetical protein
MSIRVNQIINFSSCDDIIPTVRTPFEYSMFGKGRDRYFKRGMDKCKKLYVQELEK